MFKKLFNFLGANSNNLPQPPPPTLPSPLQLLDQTSFPVTSLEHTHLSRLRALYQQMEDTLSQGEKVFGRGVFGLFDYVRDSLPDKDLQQIRYYNRRSFVIYDKYLQLRDTRKELGDHIRQLVIGLSRDPDLRGLLLKGAEKGLEDCALKFKQARMIEQWYEQPEKVADFFEVIYEKFEKEVDQFFDQRFGGDIHEANAFYKLKTKFLDRKLKGLQQLVVKQNFEIANAKSFYQQEVSTIQTEIGELKKDFS